MDLWKYLQEKMESHLTQRIEENNASMTYEELLVYADIISKKLSGEKCCAIYCRSELSTAISLFGCFAAGVTAVPLSYRYGINHCKKILNALSPTSIITDLDNKLGVFSITDSEYSPPEQQPALIMYTSGTSGEPKGAMLSHTAILSNIEDINTYLGTTCDDSILIYRPLYHSGVLTGEFLTSLSQGLKIRFYSQPFNPIEIVHQINKNQISVFGGTPTTLTAFSKIKDKPGISFVKKLIISGECMRYRTGKEIEKTFSNAKIFHSYGLTEASPRVCFLPPEYFSEYPDCVGIPLRSVEIKIISRNGKPAKKGSPGILYVKGPNVMDGYYNNKKYTDKIMRNGWLKTGDIAVINEKGFIKILGRSDDLIIKAGINIYPQDIEEELKKDFRTQNALIYKICGRNSRTQIGLKIAGDFENEDEVRKLCIKVLPQYQVPSVIEIVNSFDINGSGKKIRKANKITGDSIAD